MSCGKSKKVAINCLVYTVQQKQQEIIVTTKDTGLKSTFDKVLTTIRDVFLELLTKHTTFVMFSWVVYDIKHSDWLPLEHTVLITGARHSLLRITISL